MSRCELHDALGNQCAAEAVLFVAAIADIDRVLWGAAACDKHAWEATAHCARRTQRARADGDIGARVGAVVDDVGEQLLELLQRGITLGDRWPLAEPWIRR